MNCRQSWWTGGAGRAVCSTRGVLKDDQDDEILLLLEHIACVFELLSDLAECMSFAGPGRLLTETSPNVKYVGILGTQCQNCRSLYILSKV